MPSNRDVWQRRVLLMAAVGLAVAIPATVALRSSEKEEPAEPASIAEQLPLNPTVTKDELKAEFRVPEGWTIGESDQVLRLSSEDDRVQVGLSARPDEDREQVLDAALDELRQLYGDVEVGRGSGRKIGGLPAKGAVVAATNEAKDVELSVLVAVGEGRTRTYLVEVFTVAGAPGKPVAEAQRFLNSLRFRG